MKNMTSKPAQRGSAPFVATRRPMSRRRFLRGIGVALSLPFLDSMIAPFARAADSSSPLAPNATPAPDVRHLQQSGPAARPVFPDRHRERLRGVAVSRIVEGTPERLHRVQRRVASECGRRASVGRELSHRRAAPGQQFVPQHHFARPARRRTHRRIDALSLAHARGERRPRVCP